MLQRGPIYAIWLSVSLFALCVVGVGWLLVQQDRAKNIEVSMERLRAAVQGAKLALNRNMVAVDQTLVGIEHMSALLEEGGVVRAERASGVLQAMLGTSLLARDLLLLDPNGKVLAAADEDSVRTSIDLPGQFIAQVLDQPAADLAISPPVINRNTGEWVLYLARPVTLGKGARAIAVAEVPSQELAAVATPAQASMELRLTLQNERGFLLAAVPAADALLGKLLPQPVAGLSGRDDAVLGKGYLSGVPAYVYETATWHRSVRVVGEIDETAVLALSSSGLARTAWVGALFIVMAVLAGAIALAHFRRLDAAADEVAKAKGVLDEAVSAMGEGLLLVDAQDRVMVWNQRYFDIYPHLREVLRVGVKFESLELAHFDCLFPGADAQQRSDWVAQRLQRRHQDQSESEIVEPDGRVINIVERRTAGGGMVSVHRDVTQEKREAEELKRAKLAAESASTAKTRFLATMSHEIRTPLNGVLGMNGLLLDSELNPEQRTQAETVRDSGQSLLRVINDILDMSKLEAGRMELEVDAFSPVKLIEEVAALLKHAADKKGVALTVEAPAQLLRVEGDAGRLRQVLYNLVGNAIKFTDRGTVQIQLALNPAPDGMVALDLAVRDEGIGIAPEVLPGLFHPFTQADNRIARRFGGSGLGLAICRQLVELMGGRIEVQSQPKRGSVFRVVMALPLAAEFETSSPSLKPTASNNQDQADAAPTGPVRVLVAEDNSVNQMLIKALLNRMGYASDIVGNGLEALVQAQQAPYDLMLMDIQMPEMDGVAATRAIRALPAPLGQIPIIAMTANVMMEQRQAYLVAGMDDFVAKPIDRRHLENTISKVLQRNLDGRSTAATASASASASAPPAP